MPGFRYPHETCFKAASLAYDLPYTLLLAVARGEQELLNFLNTWVTARQTDKWLPTTRDYWFESMTWALNPEE